MLSRVISTFPTITIIPAITILTMGSIVDSYGATTSNAGPYQITVHKTTSGEIHEVRLPTGKTIVVYIPHNGTSVVLDTRKP